MSLPDWNENGKRDAFDAFVDMNIIEEAINEKEKLNNPDNDRKVTGISMGGKPLYDATKDSDGWYDYTQDFFSRSYFDCGNSYTGTLWYGSTWSTYRYVFKFRNIYDYIEEYIRFYLLMQ